MRLSQFLFRGALCLAVFAGVVGAQSIAVLTGPQGTSTNVQIYTANPSTNPPLSPQSTISPVPAGAFQILTTPGGSKNYIISNIAQGITVYIAASRVPSQIATAISGKPAKAILSPDGRRLIILAGDTDTTLTAYVVDTATDTLLNPFGVTLSGGATDVAVGMNSQSMYVLSKTDSAASVTPVSLSPSIVPATPLTIPTPGVTGIVAGPNGMLYVSGTNSVFEIDPRTMKITPGSKAPSTVTIPVNGTPGKLVITSDAAHAYAVNKSGNGSVYFIFDLNAHTVNGSVGANLGGAVLDTLLLASDSRALLYSSQNKMMYEGNLAGGFVESRLKDVITNGTIGSFATSNEVPPKTIYITATGQAGANTIYQIDLAANQQLGTQPMPADGQIVAWNGLNPTSGGTTVTTFNATQTVASGAVSRPLAARVLDAASRPVFGATVNFNALNGGVTLSAASANTNSDGYAAVTATAGNTGGQYTIQALLNGSTSSGNYVITIPGGGTTPCTQNCNPTPTNLTIVLGNGQVISENNLSLQLMEVAVKDVNGQPVPNQKVVFAVPPGTPAAISLLCTTTGDSGQYPNTPIPVPTTPCQPDTSQVNTLITYTDANGLAAVKFLGQSLYGVGASYLTTPVTATTVLGTKSLTVNFTETTIAFARGATFNAIYSAPTADASGNRIIKGNAGATIPDAIEADVYSTNGSSSGFPLAGVALNVSGAATCAGGTPLSDANGHISCDLVLGSTVSSSAVPLTVDIGSYLVPGTPIMVVISPGQPPKISITQGDGQSGKPGAQFILKATVTTSSGPASVGTPLQWKVTEGSATLSNQSTQTDSAGLAQATVTLGSTGGKVVVQLTAGSGSIAASANFNLTVVPVVTAAAISVVSGSGQTATASTAFGQPLVVKVTDANGQPLPNAAVTFTATGATVGSPNGVTDNSGQASTGVTAGASAGTATVTAKTGSLQATFTLTVVPPGPSIDVTSFRNAASGYQGLTPCGIATVTGTGLATGVQGTILPNPFIGPLPLSLAGVGIAVNGIPAPIFWVSNTAAGGEAVAFQTPCEVSPGTATVAVTYNGGTKSISNVSVAALQPGIFETVIGGKRYAVLLHASDGSYVTPDNPARRGEQLKMFVTGLGPISPATGTNRVGLGEQTPSAIITAGLNNGGVPVISSEYMPGAIGLYTVTFQVPGDTAIGPYQNLGLIVADPATPTVQIYANGSFVPIS